MKKWLGFGTLLAIAAAGLVLGLNAGSADRVGHGWLALTLLAVFAASEARLWKPTGR